MKHSPHNGGPGTPREDMPPSSSAPGGEMGGYNLPYQDTPVSNAPPVSRLFWLLPLLVLLPLAICRAGGVLVNRLLLANLRIFKEIVVRK